MIKRFILWLMALIVDQPLSASTRPESGAQTLPLPPSPGNENTAESSDPLPVKPYKISPDFVARTPGSEIALGGQTFVLAPMNAPTYEKHKQAISKVGSLPEMTLVAELTFCCLRRNYPDITRDQAYELVDQGNLVLLWELIMNLSGLVRQTGEMQRRMDEAAKQFQG